MNFCDDGFLDELRHKLPPIFTRETASQMIGGIFSPRTLSNFDSAGTGPRNRKHIGKKVAYGREEFLEWLAGMLNSGIKEKTGAWILVVGNLILSYNHLN